jgi:hypothetical protein
MTVTPATHRGIWIEGLVRPTDLVVTDSVISWTRVKRTAQMTEDEREGFGGTDTLLDDFLALSSADPEQMGAFMARYGVLELCGAHGRPDGHDDGGCCPFLEVDGGFGVYVSHVRRAARGFAALEQWGQAVRDGRKRPSGVLVDTQKLLPGFDLGPDDNATDRARLAEYLTMLNRQTGVQPLVKWGKRLSVIYAAGGLLAMLAILLTRQIAARSDLTYSCSVCGLLVERTRPPLLDEAIYCTGDSCKREQRRRNQAAWRARKRAEGTV